MPSAPALQERSGGMAGDVEYCLVIVFSVSRDLLYASLGVKVPESSDPS